MTELEFIIYEGKKKIGLTDHARFRLGDRLGEYTEDQIKVDIITGIILNKIYYHKDMRTYKIIGMIGEYIMGQNMEIITITDGAKPLISDKNYNKLTKENEKYIKKKIGL